MAKPRAGGSEIGFVAEGSGVGLVGRENFGEDLAHGFDAPSGLHVILAARWSIKLFCLLCVGINYMDGKIVVVRGKLPATVLFFAKGALVGKELS